ncbi:gastrula zinc finger protein XlCGF57.1 [Diabrotica virgifera virgifera]|uniref:Gastrula zinc finger protein XlCGF57.1-like n=1 Tax=Diabrotica virgifera virgifera TaxID=50390 RepID=A0A6P7FDC8_DIAVI|nr:gastrula zinc finger protein XlCGF57.1 [Diabrotica virgifera virgifera]
MNNFREHDICINYPQICRACFESRDLILFEKHHYIWRSFENLTNFQFLHLDNNPSYICLGCIQKLKDIHTYVDLCRANEIALKEYIFKKLPVKMSLSPPNTQEVKCEGRSTNTNQLHELISLQKDHSPSHSNVVKNECVTEDLNSYIDEASSPVSDEIGHPFLSMKSNECYEPAWMRETQTHSFDEEEPLMDLLKLGNMSSKDKEASRPWHCEFCSKSFHLKHHLIGHLKTHSGEKPYQCIVCLRPFADRSSMNRHTKTHTGIKPFLCRICGHSFSEKYYLVIHNRSHSGEKPYSCEVCSKNFTRKDTLNMHLKTHTKERPYSCDICKKTYSFKHHLVIHRRNHSGERPFQCVTCTKAFTDRSSFNRHIKLYCRVNTNGINCKSEQLNERGIVDKIEPTDYVHVNIESTTS